MLFKASMLVSLSKIIQLLAVSLILYCFKEYGKFLESRQAVALNLTSRVTDGFINRIFVNCMFELVTVHALIQL